MSEQEMEIFVEKEVEEGYRLRTSTQVGLMLILGVLGIWLIYEGFRHFIPPFNELDTIVAFSTIYIALIYPLIIKIRNRLTIALSFGLFGAAIASVVYWLVTHVQLSTEPVAIALYVMFLEIVAMELFHHLCEEYVFYERDWRSYLVVGIFSAGFFACMWVLLGPLGYGLGSLAIVLAVLFTMMFAWAVLPEKPL